MLASCCEEVGDKLTTCYGLVKGKLYGGNSSREIWAHKPGFHDTDTVILADILSRIVARMSVSVSVGFISYEPRTMASVLVAFFSRRDARLSRLALRTAWRAVGPSIGLTGSCELSATDDARPPQIDVDRRWVVLAAWRRTADRPAAGGGGGGGGGSGRS